MSKIEATLHHTKIISQPMVRNYSTGGGHGPSDTLIEGDAKIVTKKWQGHPPENLRMMGKPQTPLRQVVEARYTGRAEFATRVVLPNMLYTKFLRCFDPRATIVRLDTSRAEKMPGVAYILTHKSRSSPIIMVAAGSSRCSRSAASPPGTVTS
jgi:aldehyde oxidase/xanthine dehydrogenase-like protein